MTDTHDTRPATVTAAKVRAALRAAGIKASTKHLPGVTVQDFGRDGIIVSWDTRTSILNGTSRGHAIERAAAALEAKGIPFAREDCGEDRGGKRVDLVVNGGS
jgi:hypothetical protein